MHARLPTVARWLAVVLMITALVAIWLNGHAGRPEADRPPAPSAKP